MPDNPPQPRPVLGKVRHLVIVLGDQLDTLASALQEFDAARSTGEKACPFTTLYWDFLMRHETRFEKHPRMALQIKNAARLDAAARDAITRQAQAHRHAQL